MSVDKVKLYVRSEDAIFLAKPNEGKRRKTSSGTDKIIFNFQYKLKKGEKCTGIYLECYSKNFFNLTISSKLLGENYLDGLDTSNIRDALYNAEKLLNGAVYFNVDALLLESDIYYVENKLDLICTDDIQQDRYLSLVKLLSYPRRKQLQFETTTTFKSKKDELSFYAKDKQLKSEEKVLLRIQKRYKELPILRVEKRLLSMKKIKLLYGEDPSEETILYAVLEREWSKKIVLKELEKLTLPKDVRFDDKSITFREHLLKEIRWNWRWGHERVIKDAGFYTVAKNHFSNNFMEIFELYSEVAKTKGKPKGKQGRD